MSDKQTCETCRYGWWRTKDEFVCRRYPAYQHQDMRNWCGEWRHARIKIEDVNEFFGFMTNKRAESG